jgi:hypothetical protein
VFYGDDEFFQMCTGKKEYISVKTADSKRIHKQKRLLFVNLRQSYLEFKGHYLSLKTVFSKFCSKQPSCCVTVETRGMHSLCACEMHQNLKLLAAALPEQKD